MLSLQDLYQKYKNAIIHITVTTDLDLINTNRPTMTSSTDTDTKDMASGDPNDNSQFIESTGFLINYRNKIYAVTCAHSVLIDHTANFPHSKIYGTVNAINGDPDRFRILPMRIVGVDVHADIAVLEFKCNILNPSKTVTLEFDNNRAQRIGDVCWTSGNPLGSDESSFVAGTLRDNKLSGVNGLFIIELVSHDLLIYANNSGSPVINDEGKVIGICSYTYDNRTTQDPLTGFAGGCGSYMMKSIVYNLIDGRHSSIITSNEQVDGYYPYYQYQKPYFGDTKILVITSNYLLTNYPDNYRNLDVVGFVLDILVSNSAFGRSGLKEGDIITKMKDKRGNWVKLGHYEDYYAIGTVLWEYNPKYSPCVEIEYIPDPNYNCKRYYKTLKFDQGCPVDERLDSTSAYVTFISTVLSGVKVRRIDLGYHGINVKVEGTWPDGKGGFVDVEFIIQNPNDFNDYRPYKSGVITSTIPIRIGDKIPVKGNPSQYLVIENPFGAPIVSWIRTPTDIGSNNRPYDYFTFWTLSRTLNF